MSKWEEAIACSFMSLAIGNTEGANVANGRIGFRNLVGWNEGPLDVLRYALRKVGRETEAAHFEKRYQDVITQKASDFTQSLRENRR